MIKHSNMKSLLLLIILFQSNLIFVKGQGVKERTSKLDSFTSKTGVIIKFIDYSLGGINLIYGATAETKVRKIMSGSEIGYFYQVSTSDQYGSKSGSIAYEDLKEIIKAVRILKNESTSDASLGAEYLENKFITPDGFQIGYYLNKGKIKWYLVLEPIRVKQHHFC
jgi:hypothetical protein